MSARKNFILFLFISVLVSKNLFATSLEVFEHDLSTEEYKNFVRTQENSPNFFDGIVEFAKNGEQCALKTLETGSEEGLNLCTHALGGLYFSKKSQKCLEYFDLAEERGFSGDKSFLFRYAFALLNFNNNQKNRTSHESLLKAWKLLQGYENKYTCSFDSDIKIFYRAYGTLFNKIKERKNIDLFLQLSDWIEKRKVVTPKDPVCKAFFIVFGETSYMDLLYKERGYHMVGTDTLDTKVNHAKNVKLIQKFLKEQKKASESVEKVVKGNFCAALQNSKIRDSYEKISGFQPENPSEEHIIKYIRGIIAEFRDSLTIANNILINNEMRVIDNVRLEKILLEAYKEIF